MYNLQERAYELVAQASGLIAAIAPENEKIEQNQDDVLDLLDNVMTMINSIFEEELDEEE